MKISGIINEGNMLQMEQVLCNSKEISVLVFNAFSSSERASVTAALTFSDGMQAGLFHGL